MSDSKITIRDAMANDCKALLVLMKKLAAFEGYLDDFIGKRLANPHTSNPACNSRVADNQYRQVL